MLNKIDQEIKLCLTQKREIKVTRNAKFSRNREIKVSRNMRTSKSRNKRVAKISCNKVLLLDFSGSKETSWVRNWKVTRYYLLQPMKYKIDPFISVANIFSFHFLRYLTATTLTEMKLWVTLSTHPSQHALYKFVWKPGKDISACVPSFMDVLKVCGTCCRYTESI